MGFKTGRSGRKRSTEPRRLRPVRRGLLTLLALGLTCVGALQVSHVAWAERYGGLGPICRVSTTRPVVALSFDDGPDLAYTPDVLAMLRANSSHATFFLVGESAALHPDLVRDELTGGMEIGDHTATHPHLLALPVDDVLQQAAETRTELASEGAAVRLFRAPYGEITPDQLAALHAAGFTSIHWSLALDHYVGGEGLSPSVAALTLARDAQAGDIILAHDAHLLSQDGGGSRVSAMQASPLLLSALRARGFQVVGVSDLLTLGTQVRAIPRAWFWQTGFDCPRS